MYSRKRLEQAITEAMERLQAANQPGELEMYGDERAYLRGLLLDWYRAGQMRMREVYEHRLRAGAGNIERGPVGLEDPA